MPSEKSWKPRSTKEEVDCAIRKAVKTLQGVSTVNAKAVADVAARHCHETSHNLRVMLGRMGLQERIKKYDFPDPRAKALKLRTRPASVIGG